MTNSLGIVAFTIGEKEGDAAELRRALRIFDEVGEVWTRDGLRSPALMRSSSAVVCGAVSRRSRVRRRS